MGDRGQLPALSGTASPAGAGTVATGVSMARRLAQPGDVVLLSPGGTSYDQYQDFEERGADFRASVAALTAAVPGGRA